MTKQSSTNRAEEILVDIYKKTKIENGFLDPYSVNFDDIYKLLNLKVYKEIVDWFVVFHSLFDVFNKHSENKETFQKNELVIKELARSTHLFLKSLPLKYNFLIALPKNAPIVQSTKLTKNIEIVKFDDNLVSKYKKANPQPTNNQGQALLKLLATLRTGQQLKIPSKDNAYLKISSVGYVGGNTIIAQEQDPFYIYKITFSLLFALGHLREERPKNISPQQIPSFGFEAYREDDEYVASMSRPNDEASMINKYFFSTADTDKIAKALKLIGHLFTVCKESSSEKLRNQIINSLFWYFEVKKSDNPNLKSVFFTSVFDSFFDQDDKSNMKIRMIALECSETAQQQEFARTKLDELYKKRNEIIHGERPLLDYHIQGKRENQEVEALVEVAITEFYNRYLTKKIDRFMLSART